MIQSVYKNLPKNTIILPKTTNYDKNIYEFVKRSKHISTDNKTSLKDLFNSIN